LSIDPQPATATARCAKLNDLCRKGRLPSGRMLFTRNAVMACVPPSDGDGKAPLAFQRAQACLARIVSEFCFDGRDDPYDERDFGAFDNCGSRFFFKIDYYDPDLLHGSDDPSNPQLTQRVCTVMLASDY
jgi:Protein of unknown function (DUF3768)